MKPLAQACSGELGCKSRPQASQSPSGPSPPPAPRLPYRHLCRHRISALEDISLPPVPFLLTSPRPSSSSLLPPSSQLTEHAEPGSSTPATMRERGEVAGVVGVILCAQFPHSQRCVPQLYPGPGGHELQATTLREAGVHGEAGALGRVEDRYAYGFPGWVRPHPRHQRHLHVAVLSLQLARQHRSVAQEAAHLVVRQHDSLGICGKTRGAGWVRPGHPRSGWGGAGAQEAARLGSGACDLEPVGREAPLHWAVIVVFFAITVFPRSQHQRFIKLWLKN